MFCVPLQKAICTYISGALCKTAFSAEVSSTGDSDLLVPGALASPAPMVLA
jgi:hypothetical protein